VNDCPANYLIPVWLIVGGTFTMTAQILCSVIFVYQIFRSFRQRTFAEKIMYILLFICPFIIVVFFNLAWFFTGNAWVYPLYNFVQFSSGGSSPDTYCNQVVFMFSFWTLNFCYILFGLFMLVANLICCCLCIFKK
jgi:hypothetical protein